MSRYAAERGLGKARILAKAEWHNPGGSVKDRAGLGMIRSALEDGRLTRGKAIIDSTSGNTGIAYAMIGHFLGYEVHIVAPENMDNGRKEVLRRYGAKLIFSSPFEGSDGAIIMCRELYAKDPQRYFWPDQYNNPENWRAHYRTTAPEIFEETGASITHFLATIGTSGTLMGTGRRLRELAPHVKVYAVEPDDGFHGLEGLKHMPSSIVPGIYDPSWLDGIISIGTDEALDLTERLHADGIPVGNSSGAALAAALMMAGRTPPEQRDDLCIVTLFPDTIHKGVVDEASPFNDDGTIRRIRVED